MKSSVIIVWLEGMKPENFAKMSSLKKLAVTGIDVRLRPLPLEEKRVSYYQTLTGIGSGKSGLFDSVYPDKYQVYPERRRPEGANGKLLPEVLQRLRVEAIYRESADLTILNDLLRYPPVCAIVRIPGSEFQALEILDAFVQNWEHRANPNSHLFILTDAWCEEPGTLVNVNDFLVDKKLMAVKSQRRHEDILWQETVAYGVGTGQIWINMRGREPEGVVRAGLDYHEVREMLMHEIGLNWCDPLTKTPVVEKVFRKEEAYTGDYLFRAPDLVVTYRPGYIASPQAVQGDFDGHSLYRVRPFKKVLPISYARLIGRGLSLAQGVIEGGTLVDFVPTLLYLLGQPIPNYLDGKVLSSIFTSEFRKQHKIHMFDSIDQILSRDEEHLVMERLFNLGYLG